MNKSLITSLILGTLMLSSAGLTKVVTPTIKLADEKAKLDLETAIPREFGGWKLDTHSVPVQLDPETAAKLNKLYNQTVSRTYINADGHRIMLSIAYGGDQSEGLGLHRPEVCYAAQGFEIRGNATGTLATGYGSLPVRRLLAVSGERNEPISYWITIGNQAIGPGLGQRLTQLRYGLTGVVPDGMLVRVSEVVRDNDASYQLQEQFIRQLLQAVSPEVRTRLIGVFDA
ncbi:exosortase-associated protein EpsI, B-type [Duganella sp. S19_KUP01_CR8]|uniref:exosortase-associated protein EpsI, B-type n=1 Tax=Duganella sp. S19_KUP01_CR8 TaxID=3025502 RepID=UPI002FCDA427